MAAPRASPHAAPALLAAALRTLPQVYLQLKVCQQLLRGLCCGQHLEELPQVNLHHYRSVCQQVAGSCMCHPVLLVTAVSLLAAALRAATNLPPACQVHVLASGWLACRVLHS